MQTGALTDSEERLITQVCPGLGQEVIAGGRPVHPMWGPVVGIETGWARDAEIRHAGASGGALTAILDHLVESGTVDAVVATAEDPAHPIGNRAVVARTRADLVDAAGSRYAPSSPLADLASRLAEHRQDGTRFALVGKPCDAAALVAWRAADPAVAAAFPVIISFFCGGLPSAAGGTALLKRMGVDESELAGFRYRGMGWPGRATARLAQGHDVSMSYSESWGDVLSRHVQHRCKICADSSGMAADIVCADAWDVDEAGYPILEDAPGISLIVSRTELGAGLVRAAQAAGKIETAPFDIDTLSSIQPGQRDRRRAVLARLAAQAVTGRPVPRYRGLALWPMAVQDGLARNVRSFLGTLQRLRRRSAT